MGDVPYNVVVTSRPMKRVFTGAPWEKKIGYCRAVRAGSHVFVSGTAPVASNGSTFAPGDPYGQAKRCFEIACGALRELGAVPENVVRTRMYVTDITRFAEYGRAHAEFFGAAPPANTMVEINRLVDPEMLVEVEVDAVVSESID
jgi:enamine deaminase RidA (YjgF/YER057c/UK114 family)